MTAELIDQLRLLGEVLDDLRSPVLISELAQRRDVDVAPIADAEPTSVRIVAGPELDRPHWTIRVMAIAAAVVMIVVIAAILASRHSTDNEPASDPPRTTTPAVLDPAQLPAGSVWLATSPTPLGTVEVVQYPDGLEICFWLTRDTPVYTAIVNGVAIPAMPSRTAAIPASSAPVDCSRSSNHPATALAFWSATPQPTSAFMPKSMEIPSRRTATGSGTRRQAASATSSSTRTHRPARFPSIR